MTAIGLRTKSRQFAMQMLFQWEMSPQDTRKLEIKFWKGATASENTEKFANQLFEGAVRTVKDLDTVIAKHCDNWRFDRLSAIDRAILRLAFHELSIKKTPAKVIINEAIGLAKKFSGDDAGSFVNGVLDAASKAQTQKKTASAESHAADAKRHKS
jgi:transcription antitermination protein NusB